jgi:hypothetical protein
MPRELMNAALEWLVVTALQLNAGVGSRFRESLKNALRRIVSIFRRCLRSGHPLRDAS